jgi:hypothetical protein
LKKNGTFCLFPVGLWEINGLAFFVRFSMDKLWYLDQMFRVLSLVRGAVLQYSY